MAGCFLAHVEDPLDEAPLWRITLQRARGRRGVVPSRLPAARCSIRRTARKPKEESRTRPDNALLRLANALTVWAILIGIPRPPYTRRNAIVIETVGRRSGRPHRIPVGYARDEGKLVVVVEDGPHAHWVQNSLAQAGRLRVFFRGVWHPALLRLREGDPAEWLRRMNRVHAALVRRHSTAPALVEVELAREDAALLTPFRAPPADRGMMVHGRRARSARPLGRCRG